MCQSDTDAPTWGHYMREKVFIPDVCMGRTHKGDDKWRGHKTDLNRELYYNQASTKLAFHSNETSKDKLSMI